MSYMPAPNEATCSLVSEAIWALCRPDEYTGDTVRLFNWSQDISGNWWMHWPLDYALYIHPERGTQTADTLTGFVQAGQLSPASAQVIAELVQANVGGYLTLGQVTPPEWLAMMVETIEMPGSNLP
jgi:hypothetical protein